MLTRDRLPAAPVTVNPLLRYAYFLNYAHEPTCSQNRNSYTPRARAREVTAIPMTLNVLTP